jgi:hypothetical protein
LTRLLSRLGHEAHESIHGIEIANRMTFNTLPQVPFSIAQMPLDELKARAEESTKAIEEPAFAKDRLSHSFAVTVST